MKATEEKKLESQLEETKKRIAHYDPESDGGLLDRAFEISSKVYENRQTIDGRPVLDHFVEVGLTLTEYNMDVETISAALLRDSIRFGASPAEIRENLNASILDMTELLDQLGIISFSNDEEKQTRQLRQMFVAMARNVRVIMIELVNHLVFMRYLETVPRNELEGYARRALDIFSPLAHRMGVSKLRSELEDLCFRALYPDEYRRLNRLAGRTRQRREEAVDRVIDQLKKIFRDRDLQVHITGRTKNLYSTFQKMHRLGKDFSELFDLAAVRIITDRVEDCYSALAILHSIWTPVHEEFDDYIAVPKKNGYRSIHTVVIAPNGQPVEVQIRTWEMHMTAEFGVAAHWRYKERMIDGVEPTEDLVSWIKDFTARKLDKSDPGERLREAVVDHGEEKVFALSPQGKIVRLPGGATPLDFAYRIHTEVGHRCKGAKVNGRIVPLDYKLQNGDVVEIIKSKLEKPSRDWLRVAASSSARSKIRSWFRTADHDENVSHGRSMLQREMDRQGLKRKDLLDRIGMEDLLKTYNYKTEEDLYAAIGCGDVNLDGILNRIRKPYRELIEQEQEEEEPAPKPRKKTRRKKTKDIVAEGLSGVMVTFAKCCLPVPGEDIVGFVTKTRGISVHRHDCPNIKANVESGERLVDVSWGETQDNTYLADVVVNIINRMGLLKDVLAVISEAEVNIASMKTRTLPNSTSLITLRLEVPGIEKLDYIIKRISSLEDVLSAGRKI